MMVIRGNGPTLVLVPGINGRWEWLAPAVDALSERLRVVTFSYPGEPGGPPLPADGGFDAFVQQIDDAIDASAGRVLLCGVSFGGWVALRYAARHPERVAALMLVSTPPPPPDLRLGWRYERYARHPWFYAPVFFALAIRRTVAEIRRTFPGVHRWLPFLVRHLGAVVRAPLSPRRSALRWRAAQTADLRTDCRAVAAPTLLVTGDAEFDGVVPPERTRDYLELIQGAKAVTLPGTGHLGLITRPHEFARLAFHFGGLDGESPPAVTHDHVTSEDHVSLHRWPGGSPRGAR